MFYTYVLLLTNGYKYYGSTNNIIRRVKEHKRGEVKSTKNRFERLLYFEEFETKSEAINRELFFKTGKGREYINNKINQGEVAKLVKAPV